MDNHSEINKLKQQSAVTLNPFFVRIGKQVSPAAEPSSVSTLRDAPGSAFKMNESSNFLISSNPFKKADLGTMNVGLLTSLNSTKQSPLPTAKSGFEIATQNPSPTKMSMLDILRNFDSREKQEQVLFKSGPKSINSQLNSHAFKSTLVVALPGSSKAEESKSAVALIINKETSTFPNHNTVDIFPSTTSVSIEPEIGGRKLKRSNSMIARLAIFEKEESLKAHVVHHSHSISKAKDESTKLINQVTETVDERKSKDLATPSALTCKKGDAVVRKSASVSELAKRLNFQEGSLLQEPKPEIVGIKRSLSISKLAAKFEKSGSELSSMSLFSEGGDSKVKRVDSAVTDVEDRKDESLDKLSDIEVSIPEIKIGSMFDESDSWMNSLLNNSTEFEESVREIEREMELERDEVKENSKIVEPLLEAVSVKPETEVISTPISSSSVAAPTKKQKIKKSVSFGVAWMGGLESIRNISSVEDSSFVKPIGAAGRLLLKFISLEDIIIPTFGDERVIDIEISQGNQCATSPSYTIKMFQDNIPMDWECNISITPGLPLNLTLKIREISNREEKSSMLKRSHSTKAIKDGFKAFSSKLFKRNEESFGFSEEPKMSHSGSCASFSSITSSGYQRDPVKGGPAKAYQVRTGQSDVINLKEWLESLSAVEQKVFPFVHNDREQPKNTFFSKTSEISILGKAHIQALYIIAPKSLDVELLPESLTEYRNGVQLLNLHRRVWKEGYMVQTGGDCDIFRRRFFKLTGDCLVAHHETTMDPRATICLTQLVTIEYLAENQDSESIVQFCFFLIFKDGRSIQFKTENINDRNDWIQAIEESHHILRTNSLPAWV